MKGVRSKNRKKDYESCKRGGEEGEKVTHPHATMPSNVYKHRDLATGFQYRNGQKYITQCNQNYQELGKLQLIL